MANAFLGWFKGRSVTFWTITLLFILFSAWFDYRFPPGIVFDAILAVVLYFGYRKSRHV